MFFAYSDAFTPHSEEAQFSMLHTTVINRYAMMHSLPCGLTHVKALFMYQLSQHAMST